MNRWYKMLISIFAVIQGLVGIAFAFQVSAVTSIWVFPNTTPLSFLFIGSIFVAAAASTLWVVYADEPAALTGIGLDYVVILLPVSILSLQIANGQPSLIVYAVLCLIGVAYGAYMIYMGSRVPFKDKRPTPQPVRLAFVIFIVALLIVGGSLVHRNPGIMPWGMTVEQGVVYGWMFLGAASYFVYALLRPGWHNSAGQLMGFLGYDVVLILPFLNRFTAPIPEQFVLGHIIYTVVVVFSMLLAIYYLFINAPTRIIGRQAA